MNAGRNQRVLEVLKKSGLSHTEFAERLVISKQLISAWKNGQPVADKHIIAIIELFSEVDARWLVTGESGPENDEDIISAYKDVIQSKDEVIRSKDETIRSKDELLYVYRKK